MSRQPERDDASMPEIEDRALLQRRPVSSPACSETAAKPADLEAWWERIDHDLVRLEANPEFERDVLRSSDLFDTYKMRMTSLDHYVIAAWLNVPKGDGPFPPSCMRPTT